VTEEIIVRPTSAGQQTSRPQPQAPARVNGDAGNVATRLAGPAENQGFGIARQRTHAPIDVETIATSQVDFNAAHEFEDLPSDAFASSTPSPTKVSDDDFGDVINISSQPEGVAGAAVRRLAAPQNGLRQLTLFGDPAQGMSEASQRNKKSNWPMADKEEKPTHHKLNADAMRTWVYPTNLGTIRDYQFNIVARGLFHNLLVALPTGLGKTFIAATVMLNWYRWTTESQIVFVAPTKPLVSQQIDACFGIAGIPRSQTSMLTGTISPGLRAAEWANKRVFFMTPQTIINDLKTGICDPKKIVLLVVDEAHRATGGYAYVEVVKFLRRFNTSFRVLALTATPGASVEAVQEVIDGLSISRVEIRTEVSLDIRQYVHSRNTETVTFDNSEEMEMVMDLFSKALMPALSKLNAMNAYWSKDPMALTAFGLTQARQRWMGTAGKNASFPVKAMINNIFTVLSSLAHNIELLKFHGIGPFYHGVVNFRNNQSQEGANKGGKYAREIMENENFTKMMTRIQFWINNPTFIGHPKLDYLQGVVLDHFVAAGEGRAGPDHPPSATRIMIFAHFRDSAEEIVRVLKRNEPMIRPHVFVGQAASKGSEGMDQKKQLEIIQDFKSGKYNTLVATSIGEEGLDIGEVDLIVCYDSSASPIRMLQRMGRTGRKRAGNIVLLLMKGKEENSFVSAKDNYEKMQQMIAAGTRFNFHDEESPRIVPKEIQPVVDKRVVEIPVENTQAELPEPRRGRGRAPKRPPKKFHMPDGVKTGFTKASRLGDDEDDDDKEDDPAPARRSRQTKLMVQELVPLPLLEEVLLTQAQQHELSRKYRDKVDDEYNEAPVTLPSLNLHPAYQRRSTPTAAVEHGKGSRNLVSLMNRMHNTTIARTDQLEALAKSQDLDALCGDTSRTVDSAIKVAGRIKAQAKKVAPAAPAATKKAPAKPRKTNAPSLISYGTDVQLPTTVVAPPQKKARGRPKKAASPTVEELNSDQDLPRPAPAKQTRGRPKKTPTATRVSALLDGGDAMEGVSSSPPPTDPRMNVLGTQGIDIGSEDTNGEDETEVVDSDLLDFIVEGEEEEDENDGPLLTSSMEAPRGGRLRGRKAGTTLARGSSSLKRRSVAGLFDSDNDDDDENDTLRQEDSNTGEDSDDLPKLCTMASRNVSKFAVVSKRKRRVIEDDDD
jgi:ATP-dependent DNA helicase MPH1